MGKFWEDRLLTTLVVCVYIGPRHDAICCNIVTSSGHVLPWVYEKGKKNGKTSICIAHLVATSHL